MGASSAEEIRKHTKAYVLVFVALAILTVLTVAASKLDLGTGLGIALAMAIASVKASLVACYFMHLVSERGLILWVLILSAVFLAALLLLPSATLVSNVEVL